MRHNEVRDTTATLLTEVCHGVTIEPYLQPLSGESLSHRSAITEDGARLDVAMYGFWGGRFEKAFVDVRVFNPSAQSNRHGSLSSVYRRHEQEKRRCYDEIVEHATFTPLVLTTTGGMGRNLFQETCINVGGETRCTLRYNPELGSMPAEFCTFESLNHVYTGSKIIPPSASHRVPDRPSAGRGTPHGLVYYFSCSYIARFPAFLALYMLFYF